MNRAEALQACWNYFNQHEGEPLAEAISLLSAMSKYDRRKVVQLQRRVDILEAEKDIVVKRYQKDGTIEEQKSFGYRFADARRQVERWERNFPKQRITITINAIENGVE